jgi:hypothetical protein
MMTLNSVSFLNISRNPGDLSENSFDFPKTYDRLILKRHIKTAINRSFGILEPGSLGVAVGPRIRSPLTQGDTDAYGAHNGSEDGSQPILKARLVALDLPLRD